MFLKLITTQYPVHILHNQQKFSFCNSPDRITWIGTADMAGDGTTSEDVVQKKHDVTDVACTITVQVAGIVVERTSTTLKDEGDQMHNIGDVYSAGVIYITIRRKAVSNDDVGLDLEIRPIGCLHLDQSSFPSI